MKKQIIISGKVASGKTTIGIDLAKRLNYDFKSMGNYIRTVAASQGMGITEYQKLCSTNPALDHKHDRDFTDLYSTLTKTVIDYRLGFHFFEKAFTIFLDVTDETAITRLKDNPREDEHHNTVIQRNELFRKQFKNAYGIDNYLDPTHYDLVIKVDDLTVEEIVNRIIQHPELNLELGRNV